MRICLTGGRGMVGRNFREHNFSADHEVISPTHAEVDLLDQGAVSRWIKFYKPDLVIHAAGKVGGIQANMREPVSFLLDNLDMGRNVVLAARDANVHRLINLSSSCVYPRFGENPLSEESMLNGELEPTNEGYALAKIGVTKLCQYIGKESPDFKYKTLIPCNIYGRYDKFDPIHSHMVPAIIHKIHEAKVAGESSVDIWGDGSARREFMYAGDLADCMWRCVTHFESLPELMNVGLGQDKSVNEYYEMAANVVGYTGAYMHDTTKPVGMKQKLVSIDKAIMWGWEAKTSLQDGLFKTYEFYKENLNNDRF